MIHPDAGKLPERIINPRYFEREFYSPSGEPAKVKFGTSGHRGKLGAGFCALHAAAIAQAVAAYHAEKGISGPVLVGGDTRLMSGRTAEICAEVLAGNGVEVILSQIPLPTPVFSFEILAGRAAASLNGTASHNPPEDMGLKYNPSTGGPAESEVTSAIENCANCFLSNPAAITRMPLSKARAAGLVKTADLITPYLEKLSRQADFAAIKSSGLKIGIHPLGGASIPFYDAIREKFGLSNLELADRKVEPGFGFIPLDHDGRTRMDPSSPYPMGPLVDLVKTGKYDFAGASDPDADRFGVATPGMGLVQPNHALSVLLYYLISNRPEFPSDLKAGRTIGTTHLLDRICSAAGRECDEVNVGFKHFVAGLAKGEYLLAGEESAGLSMRGWTTEKDGILAVMLLAEVMAKTGKDLSELYAEITAKFGEPAYKRTDVPADDSVRSKITADAVKKARKLAGEKITRVRCGDGVKIYLETGWLLARPSGTEPIAKFYAETFAGAEQLEKILSAGARLFGLG